MVHLPVGRKVRRHLEFQKDTPPGCYRFRISGVRKGLLVFPTWPRSASRSPVRRPCRCAFPGEPVRVDALPVAGHFLMLVVRGRSLLGLSSGYRRVSDWVVAQPDQGARNRCRAPPDHFRMALIMYQMICVGCYRAVQQSAPLLSYAGSTAGPGFAWRTRAAARNGRCTASALATPTFGQASTEVSPF